MDNIPNHHHPLESSQLTGKHTRKRVFDQQPSTLKRKFSEESSSLSSVDYARDAGRKTQEYYTQKGSSPGETGDGNNERSKVFRNMTEKQLKEEMQINYSKKLHSIDK